MSTIPFEAFQNVVLTAGIIRTADRVDGSEKLLRLSVDIGEPEPRQIIAGIRKAYEPEALIGTSIIVVANLEPKRLMGLESRGMLLAASDEEGRPVLLRPERPVAPGTVIH